MDFVRIVFLLKKTNYLCTTNVLNNKENEMPKFIPNTLYPYPSSAFVRRAACLLGVGSSTYRLGYTPQIIRHAGNIVHR